MTAARFSVVLLSAMIIYGSLLTGYPNIAFPWYLNTEEFPYIQEILRFKAGKGYVVISTNTFPGQYIDYYRKMRPESLVDPFTDRHFSRRAVIDAQLGNSYRIYSFDFTG